MICGEELVRAQGVRIFLCDLLMVQIQISQLYMCVCVIGPRCAVRLAQGRLMCRAQLIRSGRPSPTYKCNPCVKP